MERVSINGIGVISNLGNTVKDVWGNLATDNQILMYLILNCL